MRLSLKEEFQFYSNRAGELCTPSFEPVGSIEDLPYDLEGAYSLFWPGSITPCCYLGCHKGKPGIILVAEYDNDWLLDNAHPERNWMPNESEPKTEQGYLLSMGRAAQLRELVNVIAPNHAVVCLSKDLGLENSYEIILFISSDTSKEQAIRLYYLMERYSSSADVPGSIDWASQEYNEFRARFDMEEKVYEIPCTWQMFGTLYIKASNLREAIRTANGNIPLPSERDYVSDSFRIDDIDAIMEANGIEIPELASILSPDEIKLELDERTDPRIHESTFFNPATANYSNIELIAILRDYFGIEYED